MKIKLTLREKTIKEQEKKIKSIEHEYEDKI